MFWHGPSKSWKVHPKYFAHTVWGMASLSKNLRPFKSRVDRKVWWNLPVENLLWFCGNEGRKCIVKFLMFPKVCEFGSQGQRVSLYSRWRSHLWVVVAPPNFNSSFAKVSHLKREGTSFNHHFVGEKNFTESSLSVFYCCCTRDLTTF